MPKPNFEEVNLADILAGIQQLLLADITKHKIKFTVINPDKPIKALVDKSVIEQVILNLIKNAIQALSETEDKRIKTNIIASEYGRPAIQIFDNGFDIAGDVIDRILIPFSLPKKKVGVLD